MKYLKSAYKFFVEWAQEIYEAKRKRQLKNMY